MDILLSMIKKSIWLCVVMLFTFVSNANALEAYTFKRNVWGEIDNNVSYVDGDSSIFDMIKEVNSYLWFAIGFVCFLFMVINGYKLITANGDEKETKAATTALIQSIVWIAICLLAHIIVNLAVKLFA